jgi:hypothetical protein
MRLGKSAKRSKLAVLLGYVMPDDWRYADEETDYGIREARDLLIEFVGGEPAAQLRDQFASDPTIDSPPISPPVATPIVHSDAELLDLGQEFERLLALEESLKNESGRRWKASDRLRYEKMGIDPDDDEACRAAAQNRWSEWIKNWDAAAKEVGHRNASHAWNRASRETEGVGRKILKLKPITTAGLLVRLRVIETHDELCDLEPAEQLMVEVRAFAKRVG